MNQNLRSDLKKTVREFESRAADHQQRLDALGVRTSQGSFYTPIDVADRLVSRALSSVEIRPRLNSRLPKVLDPTCGSGNFLIAAALCLADLLTETGVSPSVALDTVVRECLFGCDLDATAIELCVQNLATLCSGRVAAAEISKHIVVKDSLRLCLLGGGKSGQASLFDEPEESWNDVFPQVFATQESGFDAVVGNPPFLSQLQSETVLDASLADALSNRYGSSLSKMTNPASIFLLGASELVAEGGVLTMIQPVSFLATRESAEIRSILARKMSLTDVWIGGSKVFDAAVEVVAVTLVREKPKGITRISSSRTFEAIAEVRSPSPEDSTWSRLLAQAKGVPICSVNSTGVVGDLASATADFRDQYYGLVGAVKEAEETQGGLRTMKLATVGLIDLGEFLWGSRSTRFAKEKFQRPVVDTSVLTPVLQVWATQRSRPKVIVSNQTRVIEAYVDDVGDVLPSVPLLTVDSPADELWKVAAAIASPVASAVAAERHLGAGMSADVIKLSAKDLLNLPLPSKSDEWEQGARIFRQIHECSETVVRRELTQEFGKIMCVAYAVSDEIFHWWWRRLSL